MRTKVIVIVSQKEHLLVIKNWNHFEESTKTYTISHGLIYAPYATCRCMEGVAEKVTTLS